MDEKALQYLMLIFIVGVLILIFSLLTFKKVSKEEKEGFEGEDEEKMMDEDEDMEDDEDEDMEDDEMMEDDDEMMDEDEDMEDDEPLAVDNEAFCFGSFCINDEDVEEFTPRDTLKEALKSSY